MINKNLKELVQKATTPIKLFEHVWFNTTSAPVSRFIRPYTGQVGIDGFRGCCFEYGNLGFFVGVNSKELSDELLFYCLTKGNKGTSKINEYTSRMAVKRSGE